MSKYENLLADLNTLETQITILKDKYGSMNGRNKELDIALEKSKQDNTSLYQKISALDEEINYLKSEAEQSLSLGSLSAEERESLKKRLQELISRINYHLSAGKQV
jgi:chromosome segregation ATPase